MIHHLMENILLMQIIDDKFINHWWIVKEIFEVLCPAFYNTFMGLKKRGSILWHEWHHKWGLKTCLIKCIVLSCLYCRMLPEFSQRCLTISFFIFQNFCLSEHFTHPRDGRGCPRGVMVKTMDCRIVVSKFVFQSRYYVHFRANTLGKDMNPLILPAMG